jgi:Flp pilus assembly protein TadD
MRKIVQLGFAVFLLIVFAVTSGQGQDTKALVDQGVQNLEKGAFDQAIADFTKAIELKPADPALYDLRGRVKYAKGDNGAALADHDQAIKIDPNYAKAYKNRAMVYFTMEDFDKSVENLRKAESLGFKVDHEFLKLAEKRARQKR